MGSILSYFNEYEIMWHIRTPKADKMDIKFATRFHTSTYQMDSILLCLSIRFVNAQ